MKKKIISNLNQKRKTFLKLILENKLLSILIIILLSGMIVGTICTKFSDEDLTEKLDFLFASSLKARLGQSMIDTFIASFTSSFIFTATLIFMGLSIWGIALIPIVPFIRGFGLGLIAGFLYSHYGFKGVLFHILVLLPGIFLSSIGIILESKYSLNLSSRIISTFSSKRMSENSRKTLKIYFLRSSYIFIILAISSFIDTILNTLFVGLFHF